MRHRLVAFFVTLMVLIGLLIGSLGFAFAATSSDVDSVRQRIEEQKKKIEELNRELEELSRELSLLAAKRGGIYAELTEVKSKISSLEYKQEQLRSEIEELDARLKRLEVDKNIYLRRVSEKQEEIALRILAWYKYSKYGWISYLGNIKNFTDFMRNNYSMMLVIDMDRNILAEYNFKVEKLRDIEQEIIALRAERQAKVNEINKIVSQLDDEYKQ